MCLVRMSKKASIQIEKVTTSKCFVCFGILVVGAGIVGVFGGGGGVESKMQFFKMPP